jgi:signal transduction histidine kinase
MLLKITILLSVIFQVIAAGVAIGLTKRTKYNFAWMLISIALAALLIRRFVEFLPLVSDFQPQDFRLLYIWVGAISSLLFALGVLLIRQIFNYMYRVEIERRQTESRMLASVIAAEESERSRLSQELHDGLGPIMAAIRMSVSAIQHQTDSQQIKTITGNVNLMVQEALKSIKDISTNLSPHMLTNYGLEKALRNFIAKINVSKELKVQFLMETQNIKLSTKVETIIYRVACELIANTLRHAKANNAELLIKLNSEALLLNYSDNGKGFSLDDIHEPKGMGISNIYSRISALHGSVDIQSELKNGAVVKIYVPLIDEFRF